jgi:DHA3 family macrolide efflux protein-like MFS transporter
LTRLWLNSLSQPLINHLKGVIMNKKNLNLLLAGQLVSQIGDKFYMLALSLWVLKVTGSPAIMGTVLFSTIFPCFLIGLISGVFIDRYSRKLIILLTDLLRGIILSGVALAYYMDVLNVSGIITAQVLLAINTGFFNPTIPSVIPQIVGQDQLTKANAKTRFIAGFSSIIGPALGGISIAAFGYGFVFIFNAVSFLISAVFECFLKIPPLKQKDEEQKNIAQSLMAGYQYVGSERRLLVIMFMVAVIHFFVGSIEVTLPVLADQMKGSSAKNLGYFQTAFGMGAVIMALVISIYSIHKKEVQMLFGSVGVVGVLYLFAGGFNLLGNGSVFPFLLILLLISAAIILAGTSFQSILQKMVNIEMAGRVFGIVSSVGNISIPIATLVYGILLTHVSLAKLLIYTGSVLPPLSLFFYWYFRKIEHHHLLNNRVVET